MGNLLRIDTRLLRAACVVLFAAGFASALWAQQARATVVVDDRIVRLSAMLDYDGFDEVIDSVKAGLRSEIEYQLRAYEETSGFLSFLGDRLIVEIRPTRIASFDIFRDEYAIEMEGAPTEYFQSEEEFIRMYFQMLDYPLLELSDGSPRPDYVLARIRLSPVKFIPPLTIITLFSAAGSILTDWVRVPIP